MTLDFLLGLNYEVAEIKHLNASTTLKSCPQCLLFNPNYRSIIIPLLAYMLITNAVIIVAVIKAIPPFNVLTIV